LWRQIVRFKRFNVSVLTWQHFNQDKFSLPGVHVENMQLDFNQKRSFVERVKNRLCDLRNLNFCGPAPQERDLIYKCIKKIQPDIVLCHFGYTAMRIFPAVKALKLPIVVHFHGRDISVSLRNKWYRWSLKNMINHFSAAVVVGSHQRRKLIDEYFMEEDRVFLIPCGVPTDVFNLVEPRSGNSGIQFVSVSRVSEEKGIGYSVRAFAKIATSMLDARYVIIGDGPLRREIEDMVQSFELGERVSIVGMKSPEEIIEYLRLSDVFIQHSVQSQNGSIEGFGVTVAEASSMGLPVVVTDCGGIADQVVDGVTGYIVPQRDVSAMAERMKQLAGNIERRKEMGRAGRLRMVDHFDTKLQVQKLEEVLIEAVDAWKKY